MSNENDPCIIETTGLVLADDTPPGERVCIGGCRHLTMKSAREWQCSAIGITMQPPGCKTDCKLFEKSAEGAPRPAPGAPASHTPAPASNAPPQVHPNPAECACREIPRSNQYPPWMYYPHNSVGQPTGHHPRCPLYVKPQRPVEESTTDFFDGVAELAIEHEQGRGRTRPRHAGVDQIAHDAETAGRLFFKWLTD